MTVLEAVLLAITQGITEFLPISSDGHLILVPALLPGIFTSGRFGLGFDVALHGATLLATVAYFRRDVWAIATAMVSRGAERAHERRLGWVLLAATVPGAIVALAFEPALDGIEDLTLSTQVTIVGGFLLVTAAMLVAAEVLARRSRTHIDAAEEIPLRRALAIGLAQGFAVAPGLSRSGVTIASGVALGMRRDEAARFSFLLSIPIIAAATGKKVLFDVIAGSEPLPAAGPLIAALVVTALVGYGAIAVLLPYVRKHSLAAFAVYTAVLGTAILVYTVLT